jgi:hypothetical protein
VKIKLISFSLLKLFFRGGIACIIFSIIFSSFLIAQESNAIDTAAVETTSKKTEKSPGRLPFISVAPGMLLFSGDVGYQGYSEPLVSRSGYQIEIQPQTNSRLAFNFFFMNGNTLGEEKTVNRAVNFKTSIMSGGVMLRYDFLSRKRSDQILIPFLTAGIEYLTFDSKSDLYNVDGKYYNYWSDGTIRDIAQDDPNADQAVRIYRDYNYETDLREADLDGFGDYKTNTWGFPVGAGLGFKISERFLLQFSSVCHFTGTDFIDGITDESKGNRKGDSENDKLFFSSVAIRFALSSPDRGTNNVDLDALVNEDADSDGIVDLVDDSSGTPINNEVNADGTPIDNDKDGIPDYRDLEANSSSDAVVNEQGVTITEEMIEEQFRRDSLAALPAVIEYLKSYDKLTQRNPDVEKQWMEKNNAGSGISQIPPIYKMLDTDKNGFITPKEISIAIDDYMAKKSPYNVSEFFDLIDFFFSQK